MFVVIVCKPFTLRLSAVDLKGSPLATATTSTSRTSLPAARLTKADRHLSCSWDQGTVFHAKGVIHPNLTWVPAPGTGGQMKVRLPVAGVEMATKLRDRDLWQSNELLGPAFGVWDA